MDLTAQDALCGAGRGGLGKRMTPEALSVAVGVFRGQGGGVEKALRPKTGFHYLHIIKNML